MKNQSQALEKPKINTLAELKSSGWISRSVHQELRENLIARIKANETRFEGIWGYESTVIPELERAILSGHNICLLGLRGQAKTRLARGMVQLLDEWMPVIEESDLNDDPINPISGFSIEKIKEHGGLTPIDWVHRDDRFTEKLASPDVSVADLIGDVDPIKAASLGLPYSDERVIHYGLIPRANRGIFVINELPDLQARIQVALFNILQEGDIQIRGFRKRVPLDISFVFTANPEDYTNRGSIVTPLKDRIGSQILTHYPADIETGKKITRQESGKRTGTEIRIPELARDMVEQVAIEARNSEFVDSRSGVSARLTISAMENLLSTAERRMLSNQDSKSCLRFSDIYGIIPAITGKVELVYEGEQEGGRIVAMNLIGKACRSLFLQNFPDPEKSRKSARENPYAEVANFFADGNNILFQEGESLENYHKNLAMVPGLDDLVFDSSLSVTADEIHFWKEFILFGLSECSVISKKILGNGTGFSDLLGSMIDLDSFDPEED